MGHLTAAVLFIQKSGAHQRVRVLRNGFKVGPQRTRQLFNRNAIGFFNGKQNGDTPVIGRPLKVTFQLFGRFHPLHKPN